jgi:hypothetical protein
MDIPVNLDKLREVLQQKQHVVKDITESKQLSAGYSGAEVWLVEEQYDKVIRYAVLKVSRGGKTDTDLQNEKKGYAQIKEDKIFDGHLPEDVFLFGKEDGLTAQPRCILYTTFVTPQGTEQIDSLGNIILEQNEKASDVLEKIAAFYNGVIDNAKGKQQPANTAFEHLAQCLDLDKMKDFPGTKYGIDAQNPSVLIDNEVKPNLLYFLSHQGWKTERFKIPYTFLHGDLNLDNILVLPDQNFAMIDFEKAKNTLAFYDLAFLTMWIIQKTALEKCVHSDKLLQLVKHLTCKARGQEPPNVCIDHQHCLHLFEQILPKTPHQNDRKAWLLSLAAAALRRSFYEFRDAGKPETVAPGQHVNSGIFFYALACCLAEEFIDSKQTSQATPFRLPAFKSATATPTTPLINSKPQDAGAQTIKADDLASLPLDGYPESTSYTPYCIRLIYPLSFSKEQFDKLNEQTLHYPEDKAQSPCSWEIIPDITNADSYLGCIQLDDADSIEPFLDKLLYFDDKPAAKRYRLFRLKNSYVQQFKNLSYNPSKKCKIPLHLSSLEFIPFRDGNAFLTAAFVCQPESKVMGLRAALDTNYELPLVSGKMWPLVSDKTSKKLYIPALFAQARASLQDAASLSACWDNKMELSRSNRRLFVMAYTVLSVSKEHWQSDPIVALARQFYHQLTHLSEDLCLHNVPPLVAGKSPASVGGIPTRTYEFQKHGVTFFGLGAKKFEVNNFLPKFRESYLFALLLAQDIHFILYAEQTKGNPDPQQLKAIGYLLRNDIFNQPPRQDFFRDCLSFYLGKDYREKYQGLSLPAPVLAATVPAIEPTPAAAVAEDRPQYVFRKQGDVWEIVFRGDKFSQKHQLGLAYIRELLGKPDKQINCLDLARACNPQSTRSRKGLVEADEVHQADSSQESSLDTRATKEYKEKLAEIEEELAEAQENQDMGKIEKLQEDKALLAGELKKAGHRKQAPAVKQARTSVSNAITRAIDNIGQNNEDAGKFLKQSIETGTTCRYKSDRNVTWEL